MSDQQLKDLLNQTSLKFEEAFKSMLEDVESAVLFAQMNDLKEDGKEADKENLYKFCGSTLLGKPKKMNERYKAIIQNALLSDV